VGQNDLSSAAVKVAVEEYIRFYNTERFQKRLGQLSPVEYREKLAAWLLSLGSFLPVYLTGGRPSSWGFLEINLGNDLLSHDLNTTVSSAMEGLAYCIAAREAAFSLAPPAGVALGVQPLGCQLSPLLRKKPQLVFKLGLFGNKPWQRPTFP